MAPWHLAAAFAGMGLVAWTYYRSWLNIAGQQAVIQRIVERVGRIREELGLDAPTADRAVDAAVP